MRTRMPKLGIILLCVLFVFEGCAWWVNPHSPESAEKKLSKYFSDIETVNNYMIDTKYSSFYIDSIDGKAFADLNHVTINDKEIIISITNLLKFGEVESISMRDNTINYTLWFGHQEISCGIAYSINQIDPPEITYVTELVQLTKPGWYYYVADFNEWRVRNSK